MHESVCNFKITDIDGGRLKLCFYLDIYSISAIESVLKEYDETLIYVLHDKHFKGYSNWSFRNKGQKIVPMGNGSAW